jgi:hypothetical protein
MFLGGEYNESSESFNVNEDDVASLPNLEDMCQREVQPIRHSSGCEKECDLQNPKGVFLMGRCVMASDLREVILDIILGDDHVGLTILYCLGDISMVMTIWKWSLIQTTMEVFLLKELLLSYNESYILKVDVEGMISVKKKELVRENERKSCP